MPKFSIRQTATVVQTTVYEIDADTEEMARAVFEQQDRDGELPDPVDTVYHDITPTGLVVAAKPIRVKVIDGFRNEYYVHNSGNGWNFTSSRGIPMSFANLFRDVPALKFALDDAGSTAAAVIVCRVYSLYPNTTFFAA